MTRLGQDNLKKLNGPLRQFAFVEHIVYPLEDCVLIRQQFAGNRVAQAQAVASIGEDDDAVAGGSLQRGVAHESAAVAEVPMHIAVVGEVQRPAKPPRERTGELYLRGRRQ